MFLRARFSSPAAAIWRLSLLLALCSLTSCSTFNVPSRNVVMFNEEGQLLDPTGNIGCNAPPALCQGQHLLIKPYHLLSADQREAYLRDLVTGLQDAKPAPSGKKKLLIFAHGGLNTQKGSVERVANDAQVMTKAGYHPLFINWRSSLVSSYFDHLLFIRQGEVWKFWGPVTSPLVLAVDIGRSVIRAPLVWGAQLEGAIKTLPDVDLPHALGQRAAYLQEQYRQPQTRNQAIAIQTGIDQRSNWDMALSGISWGVLSPVRLIVTAPLIDGLGTSAWNNMLRRTQLLTHSPDEYRSGHPSEARGDLTLVLRRLEQELKANPSQWEIYLFGHSMGTIVINELLREFPQLNASTIVYMAAACSVKDFEQSVIPYLQRHPETNFYNLTLHYKAEVRERFDLLIPYFDPAIRGSLLTWIDDFFANPLTPMDKTMGQYVNVLRTEQIYPASLRSRIHQKEFSVGGASRQHDPQRHGDFTTFPFWEESFYKVESPP